MIAKAAMDGPHRGMQGRARIKTKLIKKGIHFARRKLAQLPFIVGRGTGAVLFRVLAKDFGVVANLGPHGGELSPAVLPVIPQ